jgi:GTP-binding protein HflX
MVCEELHLDPKQGSLRAAFYSMGAVENEHYDDDGVAHLRVRLPRADWNRLMKKGPEPLF